MIQFNLSKTLSSDMKMHIAEPIKINQGAMQWYGHRVMVMRRKCVLMMELKSRYCMVFPGMKKPDFEQFPELFLDRLWREAVSICQLDDTQSEQLATLVHIMSEQQHYQPGSNRSVQAHLRQAAEDFDYMVNYQAGRLPKSEEEAFGCGVKINEMLRKCKGDKNYFIPLEVFRDFWLGMIELTGSKLDTDDRNLPDNVLPFLH